MSSSMAVCMGQRGLLLLLPSIIRESSRAMTVMEAMKEVELL
jgi:hypothetical protein